MVITTSDCSHRGVVELLRVGAGGVQVDAELGHRLDDGGIDGVGRCRAGGADHDRSPAWWARSAAAICERPALWTQTNSTSGR